MAATIPDRGRQLLEAPNYANVSTLRADGSPHAVVVWVDVDDGRVLLNSSEGRAWPRNLERDPRVAITVADAQNPYEYVSIRGRVVERTTESADEHIDKLAKKYLGKDEYPFRQPGEVRVKFAVEPEQVSLQGG
jgi:PPOX class probable F420-dependent enzyme